VREDLEAVYYTNLEGEVRDAGWYLVKCHDTFVSGPWATIHEAKAAMKFVPAGVVLRG